MTEDEQKKLFTRFTQATPKTHVTYGGSGLGLFISKALTHLQDGAIGMFSKHEVGSTFAFYIGTRLANSPATRVGSNGFQARHMLARTVSTDDAMRAVKLNVLIVEDNLINQKVLNKQLQNFGWNISVVGDGKEALKWLKASVHWQAEDDTNGRDLEREFESTTRSNNKHELDIILMDIEMPIM
jgi:hypothetical protein